MLTLTRSGKKRLPVGLPSPINRGLSAEVSSLPVPTLTAEVARRFVASVQRELPGLVGVTVATVATGTVLASYLCPGAPLDLVASAGRFAALVRTQVTESSADDEELPVEDVVVTIGERIHLLKAFNGKTEFVHLIIPRATISLGLARTVLVQHAVELVH